MARRQASVASAAAAAAAAAAASSSSSSSSSPSTAAAPSVFAGLRFLIGTVYAEDGRAERLDALVRAHGGRVVTRVPALTTLRRAAAAAAKDHLGCGKDEWVCFLVQSHNDEPCDERLEDCCAREGLVLAVPPRYVEDCVSEARRIPYRQWAMRNPRDGRIAEPECFTCRDNVNGKDEEEEDETEGERGRLAGPVHPGAREAEELNQSLADFVEQAWPRFGSHAAAADEEDGKEGCEGRDKIYVLPIRTRTVGRKRARTAAAPALQDLCGFPSPDPTDISLLEALTSFLDGYFPGGRNAEALPPVELRLTQSGASLLGCDVAVRRPATTSRATERAQGRSPLLSVLDVIDAVLTALPEDGYCILGLVDQHIFETEDEVNSGMLRGRAFGGSRVAVFSTAPYASAVQHAEADRAEVGAQFAYQLATVAHETGHCFGLDHCGLFGCLMNAWCDRVVEFPVREDDGDEDEDDVTAPLHMCPICVRKLQHLCGFRLRDRLRALSEVYHTLGLWEQHRWCEAVLSKS